MSLESAHPVLLSDAYRDQCAEVERLNKEVAELRALVCEQQRTWRACNRRLNATEFALEQFVDWFEEPTISALSDFPDDEKVTCQIHIGKFRRAVQTLADNKKEVDD